jgi:alanyl-tRNA synthetase
LADLTDADHDIARQVAIHAVEHDRGAVIAVGRVDGSVAVGVGESLGGELSADRVAGRIADRAGGGAGGSAEIATGGAGDGEAVAEAAVTVREQLLSELATA